MKPTTRFRSQILHGHVTHTRTKPLQNRFRYRVCYLLIDVDELAELDARLFGFRYNRLAVASIRDSDYGADLQLSLREGIEKFLSSRGVDDEIARIELFTQPRILNYVFNPVSYFFCYNSADDLIAIVTEINNTFGDRIRYLFDRSNEVSGPGERSFYQPKQMHISPFMGMNLDYRFSFTRTEDSLLVHVEATESGEHFFSARLRGKTKPLTPVSLWWGLFRYPLMTVQIIARIHWQALRLYLKKAPYFPRPEFREQWAERSEIR